MILHNAIVRKKNSSKYLFFSFYFQEQSKLEAVILEVLSVSVSTVLETSQWEGLTVRSNKHVLAMQDLAFSWQLSLRCAVHSSQFGEAPTVSQE